jgi:hypothetical protein
MPTSEFCMVCFHFVWVDTRNTSPGSHGKSTLSLVGNCQTILQRNRLSSAESFWLGVWSDMFYAYFKIFVFLFGFKVVFWVGLWLGLSFAHVCTWRPEDSSQDSVLSIHNVVLELNWKCQYWQQVPTLPEPCPGHAFSFNLVPCIYPFPYGLFFTTV